VECLVDARLRGDPDGGQCVNNVCRACDPERTRRLRRRTRSAAVPVNRASIGARSPDPAPATSARPATRRATPGAPIACSGRDCGAATIRPCNGGTPVCRRRARSMFRVRRRRRLRRAGTRRAAVSASTTCAVRAIRATTPDAPPISSAATSSAPRPAAPAPAVRELRLGVRRDGGHLPQPQLRLRRRALNAVECGGNTGLCLNGACRQCQNNNQCGPERTVLQQRLPGDGAGGRRSNARPAARPAR
jgi:hypothetical protein